MSGKPINSEQVKLYMKERKKGRTQKEAAVKCSFSERSGRRIEKGELQPPCAQNRHWRTRKDLFADVWEIEVIPLLRQESQLTPKTLFECLQKDHPGSPACV